MKPKLTMLISWVLILLSCGTGSDSRVSTKNDDVEKVADFPNKFKGEGKDDEKKDSTSKSMRPEIQARTVNAEMFDRLVNSLKNGAEFVDGNSSIRYTKEMATLQVASKKIVFKNTKKVLINRKYKVAAAYRKMADGNDKIRFFITFFKYDTGWTQKIETYKFMMSTDVWSPCGDYTIIGRNPGRVEVISTTDVIPYFKNKRVRRTLLGGPYKKGWYGYFGPIKWVTSQKISYVNGDWNQSIIQEVDLVGDKSLQTSCVSGSCMILQTNGVYAYTLDSSYREKLINGSDFLGEVFYQWNLVSKASTKHKCIIDYEKRFGDIHTCYEVRITKNQGDRAKSLSFSYSSVDEKDKTAEEQKLFECLFGFIQDEKYIDRIENEFIIYLGIDNDLPSALMSPCCDKKLGLQYLCEENRYRMIDNWAPDPDNLVKERLKAKSII